MSTPVPHVALDAAQTLTDASLAHVMAQVP